MGASKASNEKQVGGRLTTARHFISRNSFCLGAWGQWELEEHTSRREGDSAVPSRDRVPGNTGAMRLRISVAVTRTIGSDAVS